MWIETRLCIAFLSAGALAAADYRIAPEPGSEFKLQVLKTGLMSGKVHVFTFERYGGTLVYEVERPENSRVEFVIEAKSIVCRDTWVDEKDKKDVTELAHKMMEDDKHPELKFASEWISKRPDGAFDVRGGLTIKGMTKPVTLKVVLQAEGTNLRVKGSGVLLRKDYKIDPPKPFLGVIGNKEEMPVEFSLLAVDMN